MCVVTLAGSAATLIREMNQLVLWRVSKWITPESSPVLKIIIVIIVRKMAQPKDLRRDRLCST